MAARRLLFGRRRQPYVSSCHTGAAIAHSDPFSSKRLRIWLSGLFERGDDTILVSNRYRTVTARPCDPSSCHASRPRSCSRRPPRRENASPRIADRRRQNVDALPEDARILGSKRRQRLVRLDESVRLRRQTRLGRRWQEDALSPRRWNTSETCFKCTSRCTFCKRLTGVGDLSTLCAHNGLAMAQVIVR
jgi:hypothetical protein